MLKTKFFNLIIYFVEKQGHYADLNKNNIYEKQKLNIKCQCKQKHDT